ncbi:MAG: asparagine synthase [Desulfobacteraceae bacterium]|nr:asparagine synthase [Desulfobacteraceae bacterium]
MMRDELRQADIKGIINPFLFLDQSFGLPDQMLTKTDVTSMAQSIEVRVPFLDHRIVEFAATLPEEMKQKGFGNKRTKKIIRSYLGRKFPDSFIHRPKKGFGMPLKGNLLIRMKQEMNLNNDNFFSNLPEVILTEPLRNLLKTQRLTTNALWNLYALSVWWKQVGKNYILKES